MLILFWKINLGIIIILFIFSSGCFLFLKLFFKVYIILGNLSNVIINMENLDNYLIEKF